MDSHRYITSTIVLNNSINTLKKDLFVDATRPPRRPFLPPPQTNLICTTPLPRTQNQIHNSPHSLSIFHLRKNSRPPFPHLRRIPLHNTEIRPHNLRQVNLIHNQQITPRNPRSTLPRNLITTRNIDNIDDEVGEFTTVVRREVIAARFDEQQVCRELLLEGLQGEQVCGDVFADSGVRAAACFDCADATGGEGFVAG